MPAASLRVLLVTQPTTGGTGRCVRDLAAAGAEHGLDMSVACPAGSLADAVAAAGATWLPLELRRSPTATDVAHVATVRRLAGATDVVHLHSSKAGAVGRLAIRLVKDRPGCAFTPHGWSWQSGGPLTPLYRAFERRVARLADAIVAVSEEERAAGRAVLGERPNIVVIENGVDTQHFTPDGVVADRGSEPLVVCVGRLTHPKGQEIAIQALAAMRNHRTRLRLVGDGPDRASLDSLAAELGVTDRLEHAGHVDDAAPHLRAADVVVVPSHAEGQSLAMLEAMACGRAVVTTAVAGSSAVSGAGEIVPVGDPGAMAAALDSLVEDPSRRASLGAVGRARAEARYDRSVTTGRNITLWRQLAAAL